MNQIAELQTHVHLLGVFTLQREGVTLPLPASAIARSLLAYLLFHRDSIHPRSMLAGLFWPDHPEERARRALSQAVWTIRRSLPALIEANSETIAISSQATLWVDVVEFERLVRPHLEISPPASAAYPDLQEAGHLYRGDLLTNIYDDWTLLERERLRSLYQSALEALILLEKAGGQYPQALEHALALVGCDPLRESGQREVMRLYHLLGRSDAALRQYALCQRALRDELDIEPEPETVSLAQEIARRGGINVAPYLPEALAPSQPLALRQGYPVSVALVGRKLERAELLTHVEAVIAGRGGVVLLEGEAGVGKTRLLQEIARDAEWRGAQVLWGRGHELEAAYPFEPFTEALESGLSPLRVEQLRQVVDTVWLQVLAPLLPSLRRASVDFQPLPSLNPAQEKMRLLEALTRFLAGWSQTVPLILFLEDLHWADEATLDLLPALTNRLDSLSVLLVGTYRGEEARSRPTLWEKIEALDRSGIRQRLALGRLKEDASSELIRLTLELKAPAPLFEQRIHRETDGNPLFVIETLRALHDEELLKQDEKGDWHTPWDEITADYTELTLPPAVERAIARRLDALPAPLRRTLNLAAVIGKQVDFNLLRLCTPFEPVVLLDALGDLVRRNFLLETPNAYLFSHDKIRQVVYTTIAASERIRLQCKVGECLESLHPDQAEALAHHFEAGQAWEKAVTYHLRAGEKASALYAFQEATLHYGCILSILDEHAPFGEQPSTQRWEMETRFEVLTRRQKLFWMLGQVENEKADLEALTALAESLGDPVHRLAALNRKALFLTETLDDYEAGRGAAEAALYMSREHADQHSEATALDILGRLCYATDRYEEAVRSFQEALSIWQALGEMAELPQVHIRLGRTFKIMGRLAESRREFETALDSARSNGNTLDEMYAYTNLAILSRVQGDYQAAIGYNQQALRVARQIGHRPNQATTLDNLGVAYWSLRDYGHALQAVQESLQLVREMNDRRGMIFCLNNLGDISREIGAFESADQCFSEGLVLASAIAFPFAEGCFQQGLGRLRLEQGQAKQAQGCFEQALAIGVKIDNLPLQGNALCGLGLAHLRKGELAEAAENFDLAIQAHSEAGEADYATCDRSYLAACQLEQGKLESAVTLSTQAVAELESHPGGEEVQQIYFTHWRLMQAVGQMPAARDALRKAHQRLQAQADSLTDPAQRAAFLERIILNRQILADWEGTQLQRAIVRLPRLGRANETVEVTWTLSASDDDDIPAKVARRQHRLKRLLEEAHAQGASPTYQQLADALGVGLRTIERDMAEL